MIYCRRFTTIVCCMFFQVILVLALAFSTHTKWCIWSIYVFGTLRKQRKSLRNTLGLQYDIQKEYPRLPQVNNSMEDLYWEILGLLVKTGIMGTLPMSYEVYSVYGHRKTDERADTGLVSQFDLPYHPSFLRSTLNWRSEWSLNTSL